MGTDRQTKKEYEPLGPYAPPRQSEVDQQEGEPVVVESDQHDTRESFKPTGQFLDQFDRDVAERNKDPNMEHVGRGASPTPHGERVEKRHDENLEAEKHPPGYKPSKQYGYLELDEEEVRKDLSDESR